MKIFHVLQGRCNPDTANGVDKTIYFLSMHQVRMGHQVSILCVTNKPEIPIPGIGVRNFAPLRFPWLVPCGLKSYILAERPDVVHFHPLYVPRHPVIGSFLRQNKIPYVITPNGNCDANVLKRQFWLKYFYKILFDRPFLNRAAFVHSVGDTQSIDAYGTKVPVVVAPNGIDLGDVPRTPNSNPILGIRPNWEGRTIFTYVGRLDPHQKGIDLMLRGLAGAVHKDKIGIVIVGPDWKGHLEGLLSMVESLGVKDSVCFTGPSYGSQKFDYLFGADFFIHTSRWEGLSFSVIEALACSKPCLVTHAANPCGFIGRYPSGCVVEPNPISISAGLDSLHQTTLSERQAMANAAFLLVKNECDWAKIASVVTSAYQKFCH